MHGGPICTFPCFEWSIYNRVHLDRFSLQPVGAVNHGIHHTQGRALQGRASGWAHHPAGPQVTLQPLTATSSGMIVSEYVGHVGRRGRDGVLLHSCGMRFKCPLNDSTKPCERLIQHRPPSPVTKAYSISSTPRWKGDRVDGPVGPPINPQYAHPPCGSLSFSQPDPFHLTCPILNRKRRREVYPPLSTKSVPSFSHPPNALPLQAARAEECAVGALRE
jgi:hypothetical protein